MATEMEDTKAMETDSVAGSSLSASSSTIPAGYVDLLGDGGLLKKVLQEGTGNATPKAGDTLKVLYTGRLLDGTVFDSNTDRDSPFSFVIGEGRTIAGWEQGMTSMKKGERALLRCRSDYAYGKAGSPPKIPADATLEFEIECLDFSNEIDVSYDGGVWLKPVREGSGAQPMTNYEVTIHYRGYLKDSTTPFMSSYDDDNNGKPYTFITGKDYTGYFSAWDKAVRKMKVGGLATITCQPKYAFEPHIPKEFENVVDRSSVVTYEIELLSACEVHSLADGKVELKIEKAGEGYQHPDFGSKVKVTGSVSTESNSVLWTATSDVELLLGDVDIPEAVELALQKMEKGGVGKATTTMEYIFPPAKIQEQALQGGAKVTISLELHDFTEAEPSWKMEPKDKIAGANAKKEKGNEFFKRQQYRRSEAMYKGAVEMLTSDHNFSSEEKEEAKKVKASCFLNRAAVALKLRAWKDAISHSTKSLEHGASVKAYFRRAQAQLETAEYDEATRDLQKLFEMDANNAEAQQLMHAIQKKSKEQYEKDKKTFAGMFDKFAKQDSKAKKASANAEKPKSEDSKAADKPADDPMQVEEAPKSEDSGSG